MQIVLVCALISLWVVLILVVAVLVILKKPNRILFAGLIGIITGVVVSIAQVAHLAPFEQPVWLSPLIGSIGAFLATLLWTYLGPAPRGTTWELMISEAKQKGEHRRELARNKK